MNTGNKVKPLKDRMPWGAMGRISRKVGASKMYVSNVLRDEKPARTTLQMKIIKEAHAEADDFAKLNQYS